jgi:hypothetical protein
VKTVLLYGKKAAGRVALVDDEDYEVVSRYRWRVREDERGPGRRVNGPYAFARKKKAGRTFSIFMHNVVTGLRHVDHIDHDGLNNTRGNLRPATGSQNNANSRPRRGCSSAFKGVCWDKRRGYWVAYIRIDGRQHNLGQFADEEAAARTYDAAALAAWGDYACINFPNPPRV